MHQRNAQEILRQWFEDSLEIKQSRTAFARNVSLDAPALDLSAANRMDFTVLRKMDNTLRIKASAGNVTELITTRKPMIITGVDMLRSNHPGHNLRMTEDILAFEPDEDLINMSENPLWIIQPRNEFAVAIKRIF